MGGKPPCVRTLAESVSVLIDRREFHSALKLIRHFVERIITEPLCTSQVYGSKILDELCLRIGNASLAQVRRETLDVRQCETDPPVFVYVVTKLQKSGGHTRVIEDFIKAQQGGLHVILSTELDGRSDAVYLNAVLAKQADVVFEQSPQGNYLERLVWLQKRLMEMAPRKVYLFNHHQDSVAVAAIQPEMDLDASFYHHGDHHLCLGVYLSHLKHIDPHPMSYHCCRNELGIDNIYVPLTIEDKGGRPNNVFMANGRLTTCTAARSNKVEIPYSVSYLDLLPQVLDATEGRHIHIGRLTPWALYRIHRSLKRSGISLDRFVYIPWVPSVWKALHQYEVDLYIASFPYGGGLTLIEAMGAGVPVALHRHIFSRVLSGIELAYPEAFSWRQPEELLSFCKSLTAEKLSQLGALGRRHYEKFNANDHLHRFLSDPDHFDLKPDPLSDVFTVEADEWAAWMESQLSLRHLVYRAAYRTFKYIRAAW